VDFPDPHGRGGAGFLGRPPLPPDQAGPGSHGPGGTAGSYRAVRFPTQDEIAAATTAYIGGHEYDVDDATKAALIAAGVGVTDASFQYVTGTYGTGGYGEGVYGG
jgi:hypothetical protein